MIQEITSKNLNPEKFIEEKVREITDIVGDGLAINALSGGVDSSVVTVLGHRALKDRLRTVFIENGLMRQSEPEQIVAIFEELGVPIEVVDAREQFFAALKGVTDPEKKREAVSRILSCCNAGIVPYDDNPLWVYAHPMKFFDYCASGLPVIATAFQDSELASLIRKYKVGYVVEPLNSIELASAIRKFCSLSEKERRDMGERAVSLVVSDFSKLEITKKLMDTLQGVL